MGKVAGRQAYFTFDNRDFSADGRNINWPFTVNPIDVTSFGDVYADFIQGHLSLPIVFDGFWDNGTATTDLDAVLFNALPSGNAGAGTKLVEYMPEGSATARILYETNAILSAYNITEPVDGAVAISANFQSSGSVTRSITA